MTQANSRLMSFLLFHEKAARVGHHLQPADLMISP
jgi:hypothetical protein